MLPGSKCLEVTPAAGASCRTVPGPAAAADRQKRADRGPVEALGRVVTDLGAAIAGGAEVISDFAVLVVNGICTGWLPRCRPCGGRWMRSRSPGRGCCLGSPPRESVHGSSRDVTPLCVGSQQPGIALAAAWMAETWWPRVLTR